MGIVRTSGPLSGRTVQTLDTAFRDSWRYALGANYRSQRHGQAQVRCRLRPDPGARHHSPAGVLPDSNRTWLTTGAQIKVDKASVVDLGAAYIRVSENHIDNNQSADGRGRVSGVDAQEGKKIGFR